MKEVVKRMQERQLPRVHKDQFVSLCLVRSGHGTYPVVLPQCSVSVGDLVWFQPVDSVVQGEVTFVGHCTLDSDLWTGIMMAMQREPIIAVRYAAPHDVKWED